MQGKQQATTIGACYGSRHAIAPQNKIKGDHRTTNDEQHAMCDKQSQTTDNGQQRAQNCIDKTTAMLKRHRIQQQRTIIPPWQAAKNKEQTNERSSASVVHLDERTDHRQAHTDIQTHRHTDVQAYRQTATRNNELTNARTHERTNARQRETERDEQTNERTKDRQTATNSIALRTPNIERRTSNAERRTSTW